MSARRAPLDPANMQRSRSEVDLIPTKVNKLGRSKAMTIGHQHHCGIPLPPAVLPSDVHEPFDLHFREVLTGPQFGIRRSSERNCSIYDGRRDQLQVRFRHVFGPHSPNDCSDNEHSLDSLRIETAENA